MSDLRGWDTPEIVELDRGTGVRLALVAPSAWRLTLLTVA